MISDDAWTTIRYPHAVFDEQTQQWVSDAEVAEVPFTAFASRGPKNAVTAQLVVRRIRDQNPDHVHVNAGRTVPGLASPRGVLSDDITNSSKTTNAAACTARPIAS